jgi:hypothetical protein
MVRSAVELTPAMQFNEMVQQSNEYFDRPVYFNEMADALDGSTQNIMNIFSFGATDYVGATQTDTFQGWQWDWQRGLFTVSRELFLGAATGGSGTMMSASTGTARYAWGGVWIAGLGYDSYNMGQHSSQAYEDFRQGDIRGGLWHTGLAVVSAFGIRAGLKGSALGKAGSTVDESSALAKVADEAPKGTGWIENLAANQGRGWRAGKNFDYDTAKKWVKEAYEEYLLEGGKPIDFEADALSRGNPIGKPRRLGTLNEYPGKIVGDPTGYRGQIQVFEHANLPTLMEELAHFRQSKLLGAWGKRRLTPPEIADMEKAVHKFLNNMGFEEVAPGVLPRVGF